MKTYRRVRNIRKRPVYGKKYKKHVRKYKKYIPRSITTQANIPRMQKLRYVEQLALTSSAGLPAYYQFRCNGIYDPNYTGIGHQPNRHDQLALFYERYIVVGATIKIQFCGQYQQAATNMPYILALYLDDNASADLSILGDIENGKCKYKLINDTTSIRGTMKSYFNSKKFFNLTNLKDNWSHFGALFGADPSSEAFWRIGIYPMDASTTVESRLLVTIDYTILCSEPKDLAQS